MPLKSLVWRRLQKLRRDPQGFLLQSRLALLQALGQALARRQDAAIQREANHAAATKIGIIVTVYNGAEWIGAALASLAAQTHAALAVLVVDDASTDATAAIVAQFARLDPRFQLIVNARNLGPYVSRNRALLRLATPFVTFLDADDVAHPTRIARQLGFLLAHPRALACVCSGLRVNAAGETIRINGRAARMEPSTLFFHRAPVVEKIGFFDAVRFAGDAEYFGRLRAVFGPKAIARQHEVLLTASFRPDSLTRNGPGAQAWSMGATPQDWLRDNSPRRIAYAQAFEHWHAQLRSGVATPFCPARGQTRLFPALRDMTVAVQDLDLI